MSGSTRGTRGLHHGEASEAPTDERVGKLIGVAYNAEIWSLLYWQIEHSTVTEEEWQSSHDPGPMIEYVEDEGCYLEFEDFFMACFDGIRGEIHAREVLDVVYSPIGEVDELLHDARITLETLSEHMLGLEQNDAKWHALARELRFSNAVFAREYQDFGEANRYLSEYLIEIADDPDEEARTQADLLRTVFAYPFVSVDE
jgi:hypothetical protein